ncbi:PAS domain-containing protein [Hymenobacter bucti]|uniref:histidine kinase n=1 Tax=Hymenobacter bucti TaxID=1844114 RepID=A0ABW4QYI6_9BACT
MKLPADTTSEGLAPPQHPGFSADELLDTQPWGVLVLDEQHMIRRVNQLAAHWCGVAPAALLGQPLATARLPSAIRATLRQLLEPGEASAREVFLAQTAQWISLSATRRAGGWVLYGQDITPQKQREQQYQTLAENTPDVLTRWTPDLRLRYANAAFAAKTGQSVSALLGRTFAEMGASYDITGPYMAALQRVFETGQPQEHSNPFAGPHGPVYYHSRLVPEVRDGQVATVLGIARDITELKQMQTEALQLRDELLLRATNQYQALFHTIDQGFCVVEVLFDASGQHPVDYRYLELNSVFAQQSGMPADAQGKTIRELRPDIDSFWFETFGPVARTGAAVRLEHHVPQLDYWFDVHAFRLDPPEARQVALLFTDITARKQQEQQQAFLLRFSDTLRAETSATSVADQALGMLGEQLQLDRCYIGLYDLAGDRGIFPHQVGNHRIPPLPAEVRLSDFPDALRVAHDQTLVIDDLAHTAGLSDTDRHNLGALGLRALVAATLRRGGAGPQWAIVALSADVRHWTPGEVALLEDATERTWAAMERARAEAALRASEARYRTLFDSIDEGFCTIEMLFDAQGHATDYRVLEANAAFVRQTGLTNAVGRTMRELAPTHEAFWFDTYGQVARTGEPMRFEHEAAALGMFYDVYAFRIDEPAAHRVAVLFHNVIERKQAEEALRKSEEQFRLFVTASSDVLYRMDAGWQHMLYLDGRSVLADTAGPTATWLEAYIPPADQPAVEAAIQAAIAGPHFFALEHRIVQADGSVGWTSSHAVPVLNAQGELVEWFGTATNITARKKVEEALRLSEERLQLALQAGHLGSFEWTSADNCLRLSAMSEQVLGLLPGAADATSDTGLALVHPDDRARQQAIFEQASRTGEDFHSIYRIVRPRDGQVRWLEEYGQGTRDPTTGIIQLRGVHWDVTERVQAQQQLAEFNTQLEQQVAARTQELQESRNLLQTVFDASPTAIVVLRILRDAAGQPEDFEILLYNEFNKQIVGRADLAGQRFTAMFPNTVPAGILARLLAVATTGEPADFENWYEGEGMQHWFRHIVVRQAGLVVLTTEVITARKQAEQERTRNLRLLEQAEAVAGLGSWDYDLLTQEFLWSEGMYQLFDLPLGQTITPNIYLDYVVAEDRPHAEQLVHCLTTGTDCFEDTLRLRVGEQVKTVRIKVVVLYDEAGQPVRVLGVDLDISQLQRLEADNLRLHLTQQQALFEAVQAVQEAERKRMAESLHNGIGQMLFATKLRLDQLHTPVLDTLPALAAARNEAYQLLSEAIQQTRALSHELVPLALEKFGLAAALRDVANKMSTPQLRLRSHVLLDEAAAPLASALQMALYRMAQELALNIVKHATGATNASLELETMPGWVMLRAEDNGPGFAPGNSPGLGLRSIRDRVALLRGQVETGTASFGGAYVRIRIPIPDFLTL